MVCAEATNMGYDRTDVRAALTRGKQRETYQKTIDEWTKCQPLIEQFTNERDPEQAWALCYDLFNEMQRMASNMYRIAGDRLSKLASKIPPSLFGDEDLSGGPPGRT
jgi:hypothetical protein